MSIPVTEHLPFVMRVTVAGRELCTSTILNQYHVLVPRSCCEKIEFFATNNQIEFATQSGRVENDGYRKLHKDNRFEK